MIELSTLTIFCAIFLVAALYSSVGHGGASGYLAVMALLTITPEVSRPTALLLNILVASIAARQFCLAKYFDWHIFWPFACASVPFAFIGGMILLPSATYRLLLGITLIFAAVRISWAVNAQAKIVPISIWPALILGAIMGLLSGLTGIGGGIFLTPVLILTHWAEPKKAAGISAMFILVNSIAGLLGSYEQTIRLSSDVLLLIIPAVGGGLVGSTIGSQRLNSVALKRVLSLVLLIAGCKLIWIHS